MPNTKAVGVAFEDAQLDGAVMGKAGGTAGFYGTTPVTQAAAITAVGNLVVAITGSAAGVGGAAQFLFRKTGDAAYSMYRVA